MTENLTMTSDTLDTTSFSHFVLTLSTSKLSIKEYKIISNNIIQFSLVYIYYYEI